MIDPRKVSVLLVDSDNDVRATVRKALEPDGYLVLDIPSVKEALGTAKDILFDLLIIDPFVLNSRKLVERMTGFNPYLRVLFISEYSLSTLESFGLCPKEADIVRKPFSAREINGRVRSSFSSGKVWRDLVLPKASFLGKPLESSDRGTQTTIGQSEPA